MLLRIIYSVGKDKTFKQKNTCLCYTTWTTWERNMKRQCTFTVNL